MPDLRLEREAGGVVAGVDEVGRGPWAGPVVAAAVILDVATLPLSLAEVIDDSKMLNARRREDIAQQLRICARIGIGAAATAEISALNILGATFLAMRRAVGALDVLPDLALVDGNRLPRLLCPARTIIRSDSISLSIAAASIIAGNFSKNELITNGAGIPSDPMFVEKTADFRERLGLMKYRSARNTFG